MYRIAIIGLGKWGKKILYEFDKNTEIKYCCTNGNKENILWLEKNFPKIKYISNIDNMLKKKDIDAIIIATPITFHYKLAKKSIKEGKHVFVEKTVSNNFSSQSSVKGISRNKVIADKIAFSLIQCYKNRT